jgi:hypothetical protein
VSVPQGLYLRLNRILARRHFFPEFAD